MNEHYFTCPKCGGHYFGRDTLNGEMLDTVKCHNASDGQAILALDDWLAAGRPRQKPCGWRGEWPVKK